MARVSRKSRLGFVYRFVVVVLKPWLVVITKRDYRGVENLKFYQSYSIPTISMKDIPLSLSEVKFVADLTAIHSINNITYESKLHELLKMSK